MLNAIKLHARTKQKYASNEISIKLQNTNLKLFVYIYN